MQTIEAGTAKTGGGVRTAGGIRTATRALTAGVICALMVDMPVYAEARWPWRTLSKQSQTSQVRGEQRILHALNRLTFGPRPGEVDQVRRMGLAQWFEVQLNPQSVDDSALEARLAAFPAMMLSQPELTRRYPSPQVLRMMAQQNTPLPSEPMEHAIYADGIAFYRAAEARKAAAQGTPDNASQTTPMRSSDAASAGNELGTPNDPGAPNRMDSTAGARPAGGAQADLLGSESAYSLGTGKRVAGSLAMGADAPAKGEGDLAQQRGGNRSRPTHDESAFPEAATLEILALAPDARVRRILSLEPSQLVNFRRSLSATELTAVARDLSPEQKEILAALQGSEPMIRAEVLQSRLDRDIYSNRQIEAVMTDFWLNHFSVYMGKNQNEPYFLPAYERETIRPHALGRFEDLLVATAKSPAVLMYLDNWQSIGPDSDAAHRGARFAAAARNGLVKQALKDRGLNENYARELMELHTLGVNCEVSNNHTARELDPGCGKGYTQADVTEVAKVFSGWTIDRPNQGGEYKFEERRHEPGLKTVLGESIHENGEKEGLEVLHMLALSPATARFVSTKLAVRFVSDTPPPSLIDRMAKSYLASGGEIRSVLRTMFKSPEFWSPAVYRAKVKTPLEFVVSALRATDADVTNAVPVVQSLERLGMPIYGMQTPNGYSWRGEPWVSTGALVSRMNFAIVLSAGKLPGTRTDWPQLLGEIPAEPQTAAIGTGVVSLSSEMEEQRLEKILLGETVSDRTRKAVLAQSLDPAVSKQAERDLLAPARTTADLPHPEIAAQPPRQQAATMAGLLLGSPEFQRR